MTYQEVVQLAKTDIASRTDYGNKKITYVPCPLWENGNQINLWTYWQGHQLKDLGTKRVDVLLVGQDWGNLDNNPEVRKSIEDIQAGKKNSFYYVKDNPTDKMLIKLFQVFGDDIKIMTPDPGMRLFFTNYSLGYREGHQTGDMTKGLMKKDKELFEDLVLVLNPRIIICLGKITYEMVSGHPVKGFVKQLQTGEPFKTTFPLNSDITVYGVAHPGSWGQANIGSKEIMILAWEKIARDYNIAFLEK
ncbi:hypothetical protein [Butyrivibrio sp. FC2001]|uniref:hypothetical protein n=1 Tax=Butyrivibrio sp. FC2001 TaxID=1280671 RepID=UPI000407C512|nr:hypothetical protein [Butyrivibrio sp. FC2001]